MSYSRALLMTPLYMYDIPMNQQVKNVMETVNIQTRKASTSLDLKEQYRRSTSWYPLKTLILKKVKYIYKCYSYIPQHSQGEALSSTDRILAKCVHLMPQQCALLYLYFLNAMLCSCVQTFFGLNTTRRDTRTGKGTARKPLTSNTLTTSGSSSDPMATVRLSFQRDENSDVRDRRMEEGRLGVIFTVSCHVVLIHTTF